MGWPSDTLWYVATSHYIFGFPGYNVQGIYLSLKATELVTCHASGGHIIIKDNDVTTIIKDIIKMSK